MKAELGHHVDCNYPYESCECQRLKAMSTHRVSHAQIDKAWKYTKAGARDFVVGALEELGIVACEKCGGTGHLADENEDGSLKYATGGMPIIIDCPSCDEHGWKVVRDAT